MSNFDFKLADLMDTDPRKVSDNVVGQIHKDQPKPLRTSAAANGTSQSLSTLSIGEAAMGIPIYNDSQDVNAKQQIAFQQLLQGSLVAQIQNKGAGSINVASGGDGTRAYNLSAIIPADVLASAQETAAKLKRDSINGDLLVSPEAAPGGAGGGGGVAGNPPVPADVAASAAYAHTSTTGPPVAKFVDLALSKQGDDYVSSSGVGRGITSNPNQNTFDCSGLIWWCLNQMGIGDFPQSSDTQFNFCLSHGTNLDNVDMGKRTRGALLFKYPGSGAAGHVAISLGDGNILAATTSRNNKNVNHDGKGGVRVEPFPQHEFTRAGLIPQLNYHPLIGGSPAGVAGDSIGATAGTFAGHVSNPLALGPLLSRTLWAEHFLAILGYPQEKNNVISMVCWQNGENTAARYNPLATTETWPKNGRTSTAFNSNSGVPVQNYATPDDGFNANKWALTHGPSQQRYAHIIFSLAVNADPHVTLSFYAGGPGGGQGHDLNTWGTGGLPYAQIARVSAALANYQTPSQRSASNRSSVGVGGSRLQ